MTLENYEVAESDLAFYNITKLVGMNTFFNSPTGALDLDNQTVVRMNRDTYYSGAIIDTTQGATVTIPETNSRYLSVMVVQNDHYIDQVFLEPGTHEITSETDFAMVAMRIRANQSDPADDEAIAALRAGVKLEVGGNASHVRPNYDMEQMVALRLRTLVTDWNVDPAGTQFNDYRGTLVRINGRWRIKELIATPTKVIV